MTRLKTWIWGQHPRRTIVRAVLIGGALFFVLRYGLRPAQISGASMEPTLPDRSWRVMNLMAFSLREPNRGDIVVIRLPGDRTFYTKRILGLPGERVAFTGGQLRINDAIYPEPYLRSTGNWEMDEILIPARYYFVAGDNRAMALHQHALGLVQRERIAGGLAW